MIADLWLLLTLRWQLSWNRFLRRRALTKLGIVVGALGIGLGGGATFGFFSYGVGALLRSARDPTLEALVLGLFLTAVTGLLLLLRTGSELGALFFTNDLELLMAAPVDRRAVFISKVLDGMATSGFLLVALAGSALFAYGAALGYGPIYFIFALVALMGTPLLPAGIGAILAILVARVAPVRRVREVLGLSAGLLGVLCSLLAQTIRFWLPPLRAGSGDPGELEAWLRQIAQAPLPTFVAGRGLAAAGAGDALGALLGLVGFWLLTFGLFAGSVLLASRLYETAWVRMKSGGEARRGRQRAAHQAGRSGLLGRAPVPLAIALKDWRLVTRDLRSFASFLWPLVLLPVMVFNLIGGQRRGGTPLNALDRMAGGALDLTPLVVAGGILAIASLVVSRLASTGISLEGRSWWLLKAAPLSPQEVLAGKLLAALVPFIALSSLVMIVAAVVHGYSVLGALYGWYAIQVLGAGSLAISVGMSVPWARLDWETPREMSSGWGSLVALLLQALLFVLSGPLVLAPVLAAAFAPELIALAYLAGSVGAAAVTAAIAIPAFSFGVGWLPRLGEA